MTELLTWCGVILLALMSLRLGFLVGLWGRVRVSPKDTWITVCAVALGVGGVSIVIMAKGRLQLTFMQAAIQTVCAFIGMQVARSGYGLDVPEEERSASLNRPLQAVSQICERHGWDMSNTQEANDLADTGQLHFDEEDLESMVQINRELEHRIGSIDPFIVTKEGKPDFDRACARRIVGVANAYTGIGKHPGVIATLEAQYVDGIPKNFDRSALEWTRVLADALVRQWGMDGLYRP